MLRTGYKYKFITALSLAVVLSLSGCGSAAYVNGSSANASQADGDRTATGSDSGGSQTATSASSAPVEAQPVATPETSGQGTRDNTPLCLEPTQPGTDVLGNDLAQIDISNAGDGYFSVEYLGSCDKVKMQVTCPNTVTYTYTLTGGWEVFPLTIDSGTYSIGIFENIAGTEYSTAFRTDIDVTIEDEYGPYLYPNQYVNFKAGDPCVAMGEDLAYFANTDLDVVTNVYNYMIQNITYDTQLANTVESGYLPDPNRTLESGTGICLDYSCLMASMLRSQGIPTHMEIGYASTAYHAWISVYLKETGWVNGIIEFNGTSWELMDPTFAASSSASELQEFIGNGSNYDTKYIY
ncbi:Transglutaminase-like superfamily protein [Lachnospiraceae bacterium XBB2008]|nr:Transglutaminase-like superfamily protein [Lachnospiraceae bacterium XBB2008]